MLTSNKYDLDLLLAISKGDEKSFNELFSKYRNRLYSYLLKAVKSPELAEEATLDVFLKIWNNRQILAEIKNFEYFILRVAHNQAIDYLRMAKKSRSAQQIIWKDLEALLLASAADEKITCEETQRAINTAINNLSPQRQEAFRLSREELLSYAQIAEKMNLSKNTINNHISSALYLIKKHISETVEFASLAFFFLFF